MFLWIKRKFSSIQDIQDLFYGGNSSKKGSKRSIKDYTGFQGNSGLDKFFNNNNSRKSSRHLSETSSRIFVREDESFDVRDDKNASFCSIYQKEHKNRNSQKDRSLSFLIPDKCSSPLIISIDKSSRYPKIAGKNGFRALNRSIIVNFLKKIFCLSYFVDEQRIFRTDDSRSMSSHMICDKLSSMSNQPLSCVSLSSLNTSQKMIELPEKKIDYLSIGNMWVPGNDGFGMIIELSDWINDKLSTRTRQRLANELRRSISTHDKPGYIYVFNLQSSEIIKPYSMDKMIIKIGRAGNIQRRLSQWPKQCNFIPELIEYFPSNENEAKQCLVSYRVERLIHIELQDKFLCKPQTCMTCGISHREWFYVPNFTAWKEVKKIIEKWIEFSFIAYGKT
ncbi:hypothetical protein T552_03518 [Pneumocystis carinii B80]|uniref:Bacteriophage T5 Orf172 DNA-binding domain-containing protein n=1 Tax=Pneumocystis carinii (strain B80) TaxID=1408658 RepID=A0A0W4ZB50_PNEC8|nr:hypothetical protein T552_03518 [Pneumocystis carinii B80]KTW25658.1 hypothetical protein T552_03518 [Pneumocystis carinii B80]